MPAGRPSEYNFKMCVEICREVSNGKAIKHVLEQNDKYPHFSTWCEWKLKHKELSDLYTRARENKADASESKLDDIMMSLETGKIDPQTAKVLIDTLKWKMGKENKNVYGDSSKVDVTTGGDKITWNEVRTYDKPESE